MAKESALLMTSMELGSIYAPSGGIRTNVLQQHILSDIYIDIFQNMKRSKLMSIDDKQMKAVLDRISAIKEGLRTFTVPICEEGAGEASN